MSRSFNRFRKNLSDTRGVSLLVVFGLTIVLLLIAGTVTKVVMDFIQTTTQVERANAAYFAAESGVELALYDLSAYKDGYQTDVSQSVCKDDIDLSRTDNFDGICNDSNPYRFANFTDSSLSGARGFWRLFARTLPSAGEYLIPNPYFVGDKDGALTSDEWGELTKSQPISLSLLTDAHPDLIDPQARFEWILDSGAKKIIFDPGLNWDPDFNSNDQDELFAWTLSAMDGNGEQHTLQGVAWESDFVQDCGDSRSTCLIFDLEDSALHLPAAPDGDFYAGEDINRNLDSTSFDGFNRISAVPEEFPYSTPQKYLTNLGDAMNEVDPIDQWVSARLTISLIAQLSISSGVPTNSLRYKLVSDEPWPDEYNYIVSQGFAGDVKQTIETRFRRESAIPIFSYVIFQ